MGDFRKWIWPATATIGALSVAGLFFWLRWQSTPAVADLYSRLPQDGRVIAYLDVKTLRAAGLLDLLAGKERSQDPDYLQFVSATSFDYSKDLDTALVAYSPNETHALVTGRFHFDRLERYAKEHGGSCSLGQCRMPATLPGRFLSFTRISASALAFASSTDPEGVRRLLTGASSLPQPDLPPQPVWFLLPASVLKNEEMMPTGTRMFATALLDAERVTLGIGAAAGTQRYEAVLDARLRSEEQAVQAQRELAAATTLLVRFITREKKEPNVRDLSGVLTKGVFRAEGSRVSGTWPLERVFFENLSGGAGAP